MTDAEIIAICRSVSDCFEPTPGALELMRAVAKAEREGCEARVKELEAALARDRTGLANALARIRRVVAGYNWLPAGEWGCYSYELRTEETLRCEIGNAFEEIATIADGALTHSGSIATAAIQGKEPPPDNVNTALHLAYQACRAIEANCDARACRDGADAAGKCALAVNREIDAIRSRGGDDG